MVRVAGDLGSGTRGRLVDTVTSLPARSHAARQPVSEPRPDFSRLDGVGFSGLSALLPLRGRTEEAGVVSHPDARPRAGTPARHDGHPGTARRAAGRGVECRGRTRVVALWEFRPEQRAGGA
ncbi:hypothetical protein [Streptomyces tropicalis]|uniref:Uncharacterized protein n=1 Tax=Streptomyces tropicalis TaxID=3034234 RepID=A0ABT6A9A6_9ACTN|nr:hypothetical protein [Streptomyces tropicalis]MDF3301240.1 hypothetical protein [Streptomyces tropicalis]